MGCVLMVSKEGVLKDSYDWVINNFSNERYNLVLKLLKQVYVSDERLMKENQFAQCTLQNRILIKLLVESGKFKGGGDIEKRWKPFWGIHQYLIIDIGKKKFKIDPFFRVFENM